MLSLTISCKEKENILPEITLAKENITFDTNAGSSILAIKTNLNWTAASSQTWCVVSPSSGEAGTKQLSVSVTQNTSNSQREAVISIVAGSLTKQVKVTQAIQKLTLDKDSVKFDSNGGDFTINIQTTDKYTFTCPSWVTLKSTSSDNSSQTFTVDKNGLTYSRTGKILYNSGNLKDSLLVIQSGTSSYVAPDASGMSDNAKVVASKMIVGWNLGNTLESTGGETAWGNPKATQQLIDSVKAAGFNAVRLPCAWDSHVIDAVNHTLDPDWLARVKEVVNYCFKNNMYVILNIHWDGGWLEGNCTEAKKEITNIKQKAYWEQIAIYFRDFDEHLLFASANEPAVADAAQMAVLMSYHQTFVDAVRSTGGRNAYRILIVQGPSTDIAKTSQLMNSMPTDNVAGRMMAEIHYYTPWQFCGMTQDESWGKMFYYWGANYHSTTDTSRNATTGEESTLNSLFASMKTKFVDNGIPVILGEFGAVRRSSLTGNALTLHLDSRAYFYQYVVQQARNNGMIPFLWDTGISGNNDMGIFVRSSGVAYDRQALTAIQTGVDNSTFVW
jgi:aryl-phospho-beta-D-glucosidase BglC (GH1 family)